MAQPYSGVLFQALSLRERYGRRFQTSRDQLPQEARLTWRLGRRQDIAMGKAIVEFLGKERPRGSPSLFFNQKLSCCLPDGHSAHLGIYLTLEFIKRLLMKSFFLLKHLNMDVPSLLFRERAPLPSRTCRFLGFQVQKPVQEDPSFLRFRGNSVSL